MRCVHHEHEWVTNFCKSRECLTPLCPRCINNHFVYHQSSGRPSEIECIVSLSRQMMGELGEMKHLLYEDEERCARLAGFYRDIMARLSAKVSEAKEKVVQKIDEYFIVIEQEVDFLVKDKLSLYSHRSWKQAQQRIEGQLGELEAFEQALKNEPLGKNFVGFYRVLQNCSEVHQDSAHKFEDFAELAVPEIEYNPGIFRELLLLLDNFVVLKMEWPVRKAQPEEPARARKEDRCLLKKFLES
jgi:hypothetical protein